ncbi:hypothetical protein sos41_07320 [Alphaproteobacteria bacterium SO-S41]|nr:hypothetical protein sos41_07320 [Alphaproteobacteria bacterium SO-S41]
MFQTLAILATDVGAAARSTVPTPGLIEKLSIILPGLAVIVIAALGVQFLLRRRVDWRLVALVVGILLLNWLILVNGKAIQLDLIGFQWNWLGKAIAVAATLTLVWLLPSVDARDVGLTLKQAPGSTRSVLVVLVLYCAFSWGTELLLEGGGLRLPTFETLGFQAIMPSADEELLFRGLALVLLARAFGEKLPAGSWPGPAVIALTVLFALNHAVSFAGGTVHFNAAAFALTGLFSLVAFWMRLRTGSLLFPFLLHSATNLGLSFI